MSDTKLDPYRCADCGLYRDEGCWSKGFARTATTDGPDSNSNEI